MIEGTGMGLLAGVCPTDIVLLTNQGLAPNDDLLSKID